MPDSSDLWYRLGYALETTRRKGAGGFLEPLTARRPAARKDKAAPRRSREPGEAADATPLDLLLAAGTGTVVARLLEAWPGRGRPGFGRLVKAGLAGAAAAVLRQALAPLLRGELGLEDPREELAERLALGAARGLVYGAVADPRLPGSPPVRGLAYGTVEYALSPWGGLGELLGKHAPHRRIPLLSAVLDEGRSHDDETLVDHLAFGLALALLYGGEGARIGIGEDAE